jgi:hypothetical protein
LAGRWRRLGPRRDRADPVVVAAKRRSSPAQEDPPGIDAIPLAAGLVFAFVVPPAALSSCTERKFLLCPSLQCGFHSRSEEAVGGNNAGTLSTWCFQTFTDIERKLTSERRAANSPRSLILNWWPETGSNRRRPFQGWPRVSTKTVSSDPTPANRAGELQQ